jgi:hypothetical protein
MGAAAGLGPQDLVNLPTPQGKFCQLKNGCIEWFDGSNIAY